MALTGTGKEGIHAGSGVSTEHQRDQMSSHLAMEAQSSRVGSALELDHAVIHIQWWSASRGLKREYPDTSVNLVLFHYYRFFLN